MAIAIVRINNKCRAIIIFTLCQNHKIIYGFAGSKIFTANTLQVYNFSIQAVLKRAVLSVRRGLKILKYSIYKIEYIDKLHVKEFQVKIQFTRNDETKKDVSEGRVVPKISLAMARK